MCCNTRHTIVAVGQPRQNGTHMWTMLPMMMMAIGIWEKDQRDHSFNSMGMGQLWIGFENLLEDIAGGGGGGGYNNEVYLFRVRWSNRRRQQTTWLHCSWLWLPSIKRSPFESKPNLNETNKTINKTRQKTLCFSTESASECVKIAIIKISSHDQYANDVCLIFNSTLLYIF